MENTPNLYKLQALSTKLSGDEKLLTAINAKPKKYIQPKTNSAILSDTLQTKLIDEWTPEELRLLQIRVQNQGTIKEMINDARTTARRKIDADPERYYGIGTEMSRTVHEQVKSGNLSQYQYYTINIKPDAQGDFGSIQKAIEKSVGKVWVKRWLCSYEQRGLIGAPNFGTGLHVNLLVEKTPEKMGKRVSECEKEMKNTWKNLAEVNILGVFTIRFAPDCENFVNYVKGIKDFEKHPEKLAMVEADKLWRREYLRIPDFFGDWEDV